MVDSVFEYYKVNLTTYSLVFQHFKWKYWFFIIAWILTFVAIMIFCLSIALKLYITQAFFILLITLMTGVYMFRVFNYNAKQVLRSEHNIEVIGNIWRGESFDKMRAEKLRKYLIQNQLFTEKKLKLLIDLLIKESERRKIPSFVAPYCQYGFNSLQLYISMLLTSYQHLL